MKRKTNRILSLLLALVMCVGILCACGGNPPSKDDTPTPPAKTDEPDTAPAQLELSQRKELQLRKCLHEIQL